MATANLQTYLIYYLREASSRVWRFSSTDSRGWLRCITSRIVIGRILTNGSDLLRISRAILIANRNKAGRFKRPEPMALQGDDRNHEPNSGSYALCTSITTMNQED